MNTSYRGRLAPSPTGYLHLGHARTFQTAWQRARNAGGRLVLRIEDIDTARCKPEFTEALLEDLRWFGLDWDEGPVFQSERIPLYRDALKQLRAGGFVYPCRCSRRDILQAAGAPHAGEEEPSYPGTCRDAGIVSEDVHWRFRVPHGERMEHCDAALGPQSAMAGVDFGDFVVWRRDVVPAYQLAVTVDDIAMGITEVVRGEDLLLSAFRQMLLYRAFGVEPPRFFHAPLVLDPATGQRLAKRHAALSLRELRARGVKPEELRNGSILQLPDFR